MIIGYHKKNEEEGGSRRAHDENRAKDGLTYEWVLKRPGVDALMALQCLISL